MQVIIYSRGRLFQRYKEMINWDMIMAIVDKNAEPQEMIHGKSVILPRNICRLQFDYIVVFSDKFFYEIRRELIGKYYIDPAKIVSWRFLIKCEEDGKVFDSIKRFISQLKIRSFLDMDLSVIPKYVFSKNEICPDAELIMDGVGKRAFMSYGQIYGTIYDKFDDVCDFYEMIYVNNMIAFETGLLNSILKGKYRYILFRIPYDTYTTEQVQKINISLQDYGSVQRFYFDDSLYFLLCADRTYCSKKDVQIYVVTHRAYNVLNDELYRPICVGEKYKNQDYLLEQCGDNISYLNEKINECTALYWIWKNTSGQYVGVNHYRRYFYNNELLSEDNYLNKDTINDIFHRYDIILPEYKCFDNVSVREQMLSTISADAFEQGYQVVRSTLAEHQPDYLDTFDEVMQGNKLFICNMFVTRRDIFNEYCEWLFSFLIEAAEGIDVHEYDDYNKRVIGFFAERMLTVWLLKHNFKIKELPIDSWE